METIDFIAYVVLITLALVAGLYANMIKDLLQDVHGLALIGDYRVSNYTSENGTYKLFLLSKEKLNSTILTNENDITDKLLVIKIPE